VGITTSYIRAELARREQRVARLLDERQHVVADLEAVEGALDLLGERAG
jgi:hypothetical protein